MSDSTTHLIGLISDTHGMVRAGVHEALAGVELILHAGDVGSDEILDELELIAPVSAVFGNTDDQGNPRLPASIETVIGGLSIHVSHGHEVGSPNPTRLLERYAADVIVYGHTHQQLVTRAEARLVVNPGAAGARRFKLSPSVALLRITDGHADVELIELD
ncbi:MAG: metallophosphoesterase family protein [bacterium]